MKSRRAESGATTATYVYDGDGNRVKATAGGVTTVYVGNFFEWSGSTSTMIKYYYAGATRVALRIGAGTGTTGLSWLLSDHLGSTTITADPMDGDKLSELRYKAWGATRYSLTNAPTPAGPRLGALKITSYPQDMNMILWQQQVIQPGHAIICTRQQHVLHTR